jgi:hypothetical protein
MKFIGFCNHSWRLAPQIERRKIASQIAAYADRQRVLREERKSPSGVNIQLPRDQFREIDSVEGEWQYFLCGRKRRCYRQVDQKAKAKKGPHFSFYRPN